MVVFLSLSLQTLSKLQGCVHWMDRQGKPIYILLPALKSALTQAFFFASPTSCRCSLQTTAVGAAPRHGQCVDYLTMRFCGALIARNRIAIYGAGCRQQNIMAHIFSNTPEAMSSEFHQLSEKVAQLAALTQPLRRENADLRLNVSALTDQNAELSRRMDQACQRVASLLEKLPVVPAASARNEEETA